MHPGTVALRNYNNAHRGMRMRALTRDWRRHLRVLRFWFDTNGPESIEGTGSAHDERIDVLRALPFVAIHVVCIFVLWVGTSPIAVAVAFLMYAIRMFAMTGFYHRYFAHRTFRTSRTMQFVFAVIGSSAVQRGPLW